MTLIEGCRTRQGLVCFTFALWALATCSHFLSSAPSSFPEPPSVKRLDTVSSEKNNKEVVEDVKGKGLEDKETRLHYEAWWLQQLQRKERVEEICKRNGINEEAEKKTFLYDRHNNLLFCRNAKVGTSTWLRHFLSLAKPALKEEEITQSTLHREVPRLFSVEAQDPPIPLLANNTISFSMVRHPFERLVSAGI